MAWQDNENRMEMSLDLQQHRMIRFEEYGRNTMDGECNELEEIFHRALQVLNKDRKMKDLSVVRLGHGDIVRM